jgi:hypothetical protein
VRLSLLDDVRFFLVLFSDDGAVIMADWSSSDLGFCSFCS